MPITVTPFSSKQALLDAMEARMREVLESPSSAPFVLMISGGNTPLPVYHALAVQPPAVAAGAGIAFADDRHVPVESPESNFGNARAMIEALKLPEPQVLRIHPELALEEAAVRYNDDWAAFLAGGGRIPLAFLGLGADGHTCSLFTEEDLARCEGRWAAPVYKATPPNRVTVSPDLLARVDHVVFVVAGDDKIEMIDALIHAPESIVAGKAIARCPSVELWRA